MKKFIIFILIILSCFINIVIVLADSDEPSSWSLEYINKAKERKTINSSFFNNYTTEVTREEFAYLSIVLYEEITDKEATVGDAFFVDTDDINILKAKNLGIVAGYPDGTFKPNIAIRRDELAVLYNNLFDVIGIDYIDKELNFAYIDDHKIASWAKYAVYKARNLDIMQGIGKDTFAPGSHATKEEALVMYSDIIDKFYYTNQLVYEDVWSKKNYEYIVYAPEKDGNYPLFIWTAGTLETHDKKYVHEILQSAAQQGTIAVSIMYGQDNYPSNNYILESRAQNIYDSKLPNSFVNSIKMDFDGATINYDKGIIVSGFSQGAHMASLSRNYNENIRAAFVIGNGVDQNSSLLRSLKIENTLLTPNHLRSIVGAHDQYFGETPSGVRQQQIITTGYKDDSNTLFNNIQEDGSGWYIVRDTEISRSDSHSFFRESSNPPYSLERTFKYGKEVWSLNPSLEWLMSFLDK